MKTLTYRQALIEMARKAFKEEMFTKEQLKLLTKAKCSPRNERNYYRLIEILEGKKDCHSPKSEAF